MSSPSILDDVLTVENGGTPEEMAMSFQRLINSGQAWQLQGSTGRAAMDYIRAGDCMLGPVGSSSALGYHIPSRFEVQPGTKGSREYVVAHHDHDWADALESV